MKAKARKTLKGNIKLTVVLSEQAACYLGAVLLYNDPSTFNTDDDPYADIDTALEECLGEHYKTSIALLAQQSSYGR